MGRKEEKITGTGASHRGEREPAFFVLCFRVGAWWGVRKSGRGPREKTCVFLWKNGKRARRATGRVRFESHRGGGSRPRGSLSQEKNKIKKECLKGKQGKKSVKDVGRRR